MKIRFVRMAECASAKQIVAGACAFLAVLCFSDQLARSQTRAGTEKSGPNRSGFTLLLDMGVGIQNNGLQEESAVGLGGLNLGIGGFVERDIAVMFRFSGTNVQFDVNGVDVNGISGTGGPAIQFWPSDSFNVEAGAGLGVGSTDPGRDKSGFGLIVGAAWSFFHRNKSSLQIGVEYSPVFAGGYTFHNVCFAFGYQLL